MFDGLRLLEEYLPVISSNAFNTTKTRIGDGSDIRYQYKTSFALTSAADQLLDQQSENLVLCRFGFVISNESEYNFKVRDLNLSFYDSKMKANIWRSQPLDYLYIYAPVDWRNRGWDAEFTLEFAEFNILYGVQNVNVNITFASMMLDQYRQFSPPNVTGKVLDIKSYSVNLNVCEREFTMNFEFADDLKIGDIVFFWILLNVSDSQMILNSFSGSVDEFSGTVDLRLSFEKDLKDGDQILFWILSPRMVLNLSSLSSNIFVPKSVQVEKFNVSFLLNATVQSTGNLTNYFIIFSDIDLSWTSVHKTSEYFIYDVSVFLLDSQTTGSDHTNPSHPLNLTLIITSAIMGSASIIVILYFARKCYLMRNANAKSSISRLSSPSTIITEEDDRDSYTIHSDSTIRRLIMVPKKIKEKITKIRVFCGLDFIT
jgi:hypothetical protein